MGRAAASLMLAGACMLVSPLTAGAQRGGGPAPAPVFVQPPPINRSLGTIDTRPINRPPGMDVPSTGSPFDARPGTYTQLQPIPPQFGVLFGYGFNTPRYGNRRSKTRPPLTDGFLFLDVQPRAAQVFVDGAFVGNAGDLAAGSALTLSAGRHQISLEAPGFETRTLDVMIVAGEPTRYRAELVAVRPAAAPAPAGPPQTMYVIPGCYGGNRPPVAASLPRGCDIARLKTLRPPARL